MPLERMRADPRDWRLAHVERLCLSFGIDCTPPRKGSQGEAPGGAVDPDHSGASSDQANLHHGSGARSMTPQDYRVTIRPPVAEDGGGFAAIVPDLSGCRSDGETPQETLDQASDAIACRIEAAEEMGRPIPEPRRHAA